MIDTRFMNWVDFDALRKETDLVLMPFGAVEVYGPHLPMGADGISTSALAERVAAEETAFVAPLIPVGYSKALADFPGTLIYYMGVRRAAGDRGPTPGQRLSARLRRMRAASAR